MNRPFLRATAFALLMLALPGILLAQAAKAAPTPAPVEGRDYVVIDGGRPWQPLAGRIEVVEVFAYSCHHCRDFQPLVDAWKKTLRRDVRFSYVPAAFNPQDGYARAFFAAEALGATARTHHALFRAIHDQQSLPARGASDQELAAFHAGLGVKPAGFLAAMRSPATDEKMAAAREFAVRSGIEGTPTLVVNGRYRVTARTLQDSLRIADALVAAERRAAKP